MATVSPEPSAPANEGEDARRLLKVLLTDPFLAIEGEGFRRLPPDATLAVCTSYDDTEFARLAADADVLAGRNPFAALPQVLVTLHLAGASRGSTARLVARSAANIRRFLAGEPMRDPIPGLAGATS